MPLLLFLSDLGSLHSCFLHCGSGEVVGVPLCLDQPGKAVEGWGRWGEFFFGGGGGVMDGVRLLFSPHATLPPLAAAFLL